jgi:hypothetical protein
MSEPTVIINIFNGQSPCTCGQKSTPNPAPEPPGDADPPCSSCTWSLKDIGMVALEGKLAEKASGGYPISNAKFELYRKDGSIVSRYPLEKAVDAGVVVDETFKMDTEGAENAMFTYTAKDGSTHKNKITFTTKV